MDLKYSKIRNENGKKTVSMYIFGIIGYDIIGEEFARELKYLHEQMNITDLEIFINSPGGSVVSGYSIVGALLHAQKKGVNINILNVGVAYSMGGIILVAGQNRDSYDYGSVMIHDPSFEDRDDKDLSDTDKKFIEVIKNSLATIIANNTGIETDEVLNLMKTETVYSAVEAKKNKFIDRVIKTDRQVNLDNKTNIEKMVAFSNIFPNNFTNQNTKKMNRIALLLGLNAEASEEAIIKALNALFAQKDAKDFKNENDTLIAKVKELETKFANVEKAAKKEKADSLIAKFVKDGIIPDEPEVINTWTDNAVEKFDETEKMLKVLKPQTKQINNSLKKDKDGKVIKPTVGTDLADQFDELMSKPVEMDALKEKDPDQFKKLEDAWSAKYDKDFAVEIEK